MHAGYDWSHVIPETGIQRRPVILLSTHWGEPRPSVIAHEYRHYQQCMLKAPTALPLPDAQIANPPEYDGTYAGWVAGNRAFYRRPWERDALLYEIGRAHV